VKPLASGHLLTELEDSVLTVTLNRPERLNAVTIQMLDVLRETFQAADADDGVRCVVVTGRGRAFCAGADLSEGASRFDYAGAGEGPEEHRDKGGTVTLAAHACRKPVIGALNGAAAGFGASFPLGFDVRLASETARIGFVYARRGIVTEGVSSWFLPRLVGMGKALEWMSTGRMVNAPEGLAAGLFHSIHPTDQLLPAARALAREIVENTSAVSVAVIRKLLWRGLEFGSPMESHFLESRLMYERGASADAREGVAAFLEKRPPRFPDRLSENYPELLSEPR
jgi:enoyl-CoA hydratase/carnithine racemase